MDDIYIPTHFIRFNRPLRAILIDDEPWFVARDFGLLMGRTKPEGILHLLDEDQRALVTLRQGDCYETQEVISESATYAAYYRYRHPENRQVRRWLTQAGLKPAPLKALPPSNGEGLTVQLWAATRKA